jgi:hypothetical protein
MKQSRRTRILAAVVTASILAVPAAAHASHIRSVYSTTSATNGVVSWTLINATESGDPSSFSPDDIELLTSVADGVGSGTSTSDSFTEISRVEDESNSLYAETTQVFTVDVSGFSDGLYEAYAENCCRLDGVQNSDGEDTTSAWIRFTVTSGVPNLPPVFNSPSLYELIAPNGTVTADFRATDPEGGAVTYTYLTDTENPVYAGTAIPCSSFSAGQLTIGAAHCSGGDVFATIFDADNPDYGSDIPSWTAKVEAKDAQGNVATSDVLFRLLVAPEPYIDDDRFVGGSDYELDIFAPDTVSDFVSVECVNDEDSSDIVTAEGPSSPLTVRNLQVGATYTCTPYAENSAGGNDGDTYELGPVEGILLNLNLAVGVEFSGATSNIVGGGLKPASAFTLTMYSDPIEIYAGITDGDGNFDEDITIPAEACIPGVHQLVLAGIDSSDEVVTDEQWVDLSSSCTVLRFSNTELTPTLAETGFDFGTGLTAASALVLLGSGLIVARRRAAVRR